MQPPVLAIVLGAILLVSGCTSSPASTSGTPAGAGAGARAESATTLATPENATVAAPLSVQKFQGTASGAGMKGTACAGPSNRVAGDVGEFPIEAEGSLLHVELAFEPSTSGADVLRIWLVQGSLDPTDIVWKESDHPDVADEQGGSPIAFDVRREKLGDATTVTFIVQICNGVGAVVPFQGAASFFEGDVPADYSALTG